MPHLRDGAAFVDIGQRLNGPLDRPKQTPLKSTSGGHFNGPLHCLDTKRAKDYEAKWHAAVGVVSLVQLLCEGLEGQCAWESKCLQVLCMYIC